MSRTEKELKAILNTAEFNSAEWKSASEELHAIRVADIEKNPAVLGKNWCTSDGQWWK